MIFPLELPFLKGFSIAMLNNQMVYICDGKFQLYNGQVFFVVSACALVRKPMRIANKTGHGAVIESIRPRTYSSWHLGNCWHVLVEYQLAWIFGHV